MNERVGFYLSLTEMMVKEFEKAVRSEAKAQGKDLDFVTVPELTGIVEGVIARLEKLEKPNA